MDADFQLLIDNTLSVSAQVSQFIDEVTKMEVASKQIDEAALNRTVTFKTYIDGSLSDINKVNSLSQTIEIVFDIAEDIVAYIEGELARQSPVKSGKYLASHVLFADGVQVENLSAVPVARELLFVNIQPYSEKIEQGESSMAPNGVYEVTANEAQKQFPSSKIEYIDYVGVFGNMAQATNATYGRRTTLHMNKSNNRFPAIRVTK